MIAKTSKTGVSRRPDITEQCEQSCRFQRFLSWPVDMERCSNLQSSVLQTLRKPGSLPPVRSKVPGPWLQNSTGFKVSAPGHWFKASRPSLGTHSPRYLPLCGGRGSRGAGNGSSVGADLRAWSLRPGLLRSSEGRWSPRGGRHAFSQRGLRC